MYFVLIAPNLPFWSLVDRYIYSLLFLASCGAPPCVYHLCFAYPNQFSLSFLVPFGGRLRISLSLLFVFFFMVSLPSLPSTTISLHTPTTTSLVIYMCVLDSTSPPCELENVRLINLCPPSSSIYVDAVYALVWTGGEAPPFHSSEWWWVSKRSEGCTW